MPDFIDDNFIREWRRIRAKVDGLRGDGVTNTPSAISISAPIPRGTAPPDDAPDDVYPARLTGTGTPAGSYAWSEQDAHADGTFADRTNGRTSATRDVAYEVNGSTSVPTGSTTGAVVWIHERYDSTAQKVVYDFAYGAGSPVLWGKLKTAWDGSATVTLTPCAGPNDATATGAADITCFILGRYGTPSGLIPTGFAPGSFVANVGDILDYVMTYTDATTPANSRGTLVSPPLNDQSGNLYDVLQRDGGGKIVNGLVRAI